MGKWLRLWPHEHSWVTMKCYADMRPRINNGKGGICTVCQRCGKHKYPHGIAHWYGRFQ